MLTCCHTPMHVCITIHKNTQYNISHHKPIKLHKTWMKADAPCAHTNALCMHNHTHSHVPIRTTFVQSYAYHIHCICIHMHYVGTHKHTTQMHTLHMPTWMSTYTICGEVTTHTCLCTHTHHMKHTCTVYTRPRERVIAHITTHAPCMHGQIHHLYTHARACVHPHTADACKHTRSQHMCTQVHYAYTQMEQRCTCNYAPTTQIRRVRTHTCTLTYAEHACRRLSARAPSQVLAAGPAGPPVIAPSPGVWQIALAARRRPLLINPRLSRAPSAGARNCGPAGPAPARARNQKADFRAGHLFAGLRLLPPPCFISAPR